MLIAREVIWVVSNLTPFLKEFLFENDEIKATIKYNKSFIAMMLLNMLLIAGLLFITEESTRLVAQNKVLNDHNQQMTTVIKTLEKENDQLKLSRPKAIDKESTATASSAPAQTPQDIYETLRSKS